MGVICPSRVGPAGRPAVGIVRQARRPLRSTKIDLASQCAFGKHTAREKDSVVSLVKHCRVLAGAVGIFISLANRNPI